MAIVTRLRNPTLKFPEGIPDYCPPTEAFDPPCDVYRAIPRPKIADSDLKSWAEEGRTSVKLSDCRSWGLSVWTDPKAVEHARDINNAMRDRYIARAQLQSGDGKVAATPSRKQPQHHTFWCNTEVDLKPRFQVFLKPDA